MDTFHDLRKGKVAARFLTTDFCPSANRLPLRKEPVGWFVLATCISVRSDLLCTHRWTLLCADIGHRSWHGLASGSSTRGDLFPATKDPQVHEDDLCELQFDPELAAHAALGLSVEGFLDRSCEQVDTDKIPTVALAFVRGLTTSTYRFSTSRISEAVIQMDATLTCSFPFGI